MMKHFTGSVARPANLPGAVSTSHPVATTPQGATNGSWGKDERSIRTSRRGWKFAKEPLGSKLAGLAVLVWLAFSAASWAAEASTSKETVPPADEAGFMPLFNGKDLAGWEGNPERWTAQDGQLIGRSPGMKQYDFLATTRTFGDFILRFQIQLVDGKGNTGLLYRSKRVPNSDLVSGYQADFAPGKHGNLFDEARRQKILAAPDPKTVAAAVKPADWNDYEVRAEGVRLTHFINGVKLMEFTEADASIPRQGVIALQIHKGEPMEVRFRNLRIKELSLAKGAASMSGSGTAPETARPSAKEPGANLKSQVVRWNDVKRQAANWGELRQHFSGQTFATENVFIATAIVQPGKFNHKAHRHAEEEYMILVEGTGTWALGDQEIPARCGDAVYAEPWLYHGFTNTGNTPAKYVVLRYKGKGVSLPARPDHRSNEPVKPDGKTGK
jgi:mannose-6-phosphate isomerase-like protein (cupin superfamily)